MSSAGARQVVATALSASVLIAAAKLWAALASSTSALLAATVHSLIDTSCLGLLFLGMWNISAATAGPQQRTQSPDITLYFWSFVVAILLYAMGGGIALYEGVERLARPQPLVTPSTDLVTLAVAAAAWALIALMALRGYRAVGASTGPLQAAVERPDVAPTIAVMVIATAASAGNLLALGGLLGAANGGDPRSDAFAAVAVGLVMSAVAAFMAIEVKRLLMARLAPPAGSELGSAKTSPLKVEPSRTGDRVSAASLSPQPEVALETKSMPTAGAPPTLSDARKEATEPARETSLPSPASVPNKDFPPPKPPVTARQAERKGRGKRRR